MHLVSQSISLSGYDARSFCLIWFPNRTHLYRFPVSHLHNAEYLILVLAFLVNVSHRFSYVLHRIIANLLQRFLSGIQPSLANSIHLGLTTISHQSDHMEWPSKRPNRIIQFFQVENNNSTVRTVSYHNGQLWNVQEKCSWRTELANQRL